MELIKHECGVAMIRLLKPLDYYKEKYGSVYYGLNKLYLIMEIMELKISSTLVMLKFPQRSILRELQLLRLMKGCT